MLHPAIRNRLAATLCAIFPLATLVVHAMIASVAAASVSPKGEPRVEIVTAEDAAATAQLDYEIGALTTTLAGVAPQVLPFSSDTFGDCPSATSPAARIACLSQAVAQLQALSTEAKLASVGADPQFIPPVYGIITSGFGYRKPPVGNRKKAKAVMHEGLDLAAPRDALFVAPADGTIVALERKTGYGALLTVAHANGFETRFAHAGAIFVQAGDRVRRGQALGVVGVSGSTTGPHVHYEMRLDGKLIDPRPYVDLPTVKDLMRIAHH